MEELPNQNCFGIDLVIFPCVMVFLASQNCVPFRKGGHRKKGAEKRPESLV